MTELWIIDQLVQQGVRHFCIAPGARSALLASAAFEHPGTTIHIHYDERGLGFFALGIGKGTNRPAALIATSGTAVGNLLPSIMEAHHSCTPMVVLSADRPDELRDCSANQTTDQMKIFHSFVRWQTEIGPHGEEKTVRSKMGQAFFYTLQNPPGPVHINCPFGEPLYRPGNPISFGKPIDLRFPEHRAAPYRTQASKGVILIGRLPKEEDIFPILQLAHRLRWPICADILSNARSHRTEEQIDYYDWIEKPAPELALHFGERVTSKKILDFLKKKGTEYIHISPFPFLQDPERMIAARIQSDILPFCASFEANTDPEWLPLWKKKDTPPRFEEKQGVFTEVHAMRKIGALLSPEYALFLGNGMPIRDGDHFFFPSKCRRFFGNRGLSGIDGNIATLAALCEEMPTLAIIGDQAALHDLNSLPLLKKTKYPAILLIFNNFGGGTFDQLPFSQSPHFETLWGSPCQATFGQAAALFDLPYFGFESLEERLRQKSSCLIELITDRKENHAYRNSCLPPPS